MNNFDVPLTANTKTESHVLHMSRDKWIMNKKEIYFVRVKISFKLVLHPVAYKIVSLKSIQALGFLS